MMVDFYHKIDERGWIKKITGEEIISFQDDLGRN
jgi:hypothetical protein